MSFQVQMGIASTVLEILELFKKVFVELIKGGNSR